MYSPKNVGDMLNLSPSTLRRYSVAFADLLSEQARTPANKHRQYNDTDIIILRRVRELSSQRKTPQEIRDALQVVEPHPPSNLALLPDVIAEFENLRQVITGQAEQIDALTTQLHKAFQRLNRLERPWYKRLFQPDKEGQDAPPGPQNGL